MLNVLKHCLKKKKKMMTNNSKITVELLEENHPIKPFDCEDEDIDLLEYAEMNTPSFSIYIYIIIY
jgi:hypothetical protein